MIVYSDPSFISHPWIARFIAIACFNENSRQLFIFIRKPDDHTKSKSLESVLCT